MIEWHLGTIGFSYQDWSSVFYPDGLSKRDYLIHYSQFFNSVELDSTFYGTPRPEYVQRWKAITPPDFSFCVKTPREITHDKRLVDARIEMDHFLNTMKLLGGKLGVVLIQLPPDMTFSHIHNLAVFLRQLPPDVRYAVEFRNQSWVATGTEQLLMNNNIGWVSTDYIHLPQRVFVTTDFIYIRWIGRHGQYDVKDHERQDMTSRLERWWADIRKQQASLDKVYGYFNNDFSGHSPATCNRFKEIVGLSTKPLKPPQQGSLF